MAEQCINCGVKISDGGLLSAGNRYLSDTVLKLVNLVEGASYQALCESCGEQLRIEAQHKLNRELEERKSYLERTVPEFPMLTVDVLPGTNEYRALGLVTANVAVGTGLFNEFSQSLSDLFGAVNEQSGMAFKVNKGEAAARSILVKKALGMGANAIIGVDIDYGITTNNAATVNMQGTAVFVPNPAAVFGENAAKVSGWVDWTWKRLNQLRRWERGDVREGDVFAVSLPE